MKKNRIIYKIIFLIIIIISIYIKINYFKEEIIKENIVDEPNNITKILNYNLDNELINEEFLKWIENKYGDKSIEIILNDLENNNYSLNSFYKATKNSFIVLKDYCLNNNGDNIKVINSQNNDITLSFIGDVSLADNYAIMPKYIERNKKILGILDERVVKILNDADISVANNEFTVGTMDTPMKKKKFTFRAKEENLKVYAEMGIDLVTLANNHVYDYGTESFYNLLSSLEKLDLPHIGAGRDLNEAKKPYYFIVNGFKIAFVNASRAEKNILTPGATIDSPGVLRCYDPEEFLKTIKEAKENSDYVIALIHWGKENYHTLEDEQLTTSKMYIDAGADLIVGTHAHVLQGFEFYQNKLIAYNLGDFIFSHKTKDTGILNVKIDNDGNFKYYFDPCLEKDEYTKLLDNEDKQRILKDLESYSLNVKILEDGQIIPS